jgi:mono/diheme cytochrome c family protein
MTAIVMIAALVTLPTLAAEPSADDIDQGRALYDDNCSSCHGRDMVTSGVAAFDLRRFPKDDESRFRNSVLAGKGGMPAWRDKLSDADLQLLWAYVRSGG